MLMEDVRAGRVIQKIVYGNEADEPVAAPAGAPPVPSLLIGRQEDLKNLKRLANGEHRLMIVRGWPGVGKSTIVAALAHDSEVESSFPDGILWTSLGQTPRIISALAMWGRVFGTDEILKATSLKEGVAQMAGLLRDKRSLLIVDDVWEVEHAEPFRQVRGKDCSLLITTREAQVAEKMSSPDNVYMLEPLSHSSALELLGALSPQVLEKYGTFASELVDDLECLPLALHVAGRMLNVEIERGWGVEDLLRELRSGARILEQKAPADRIDLENQTIPTVAVLLQKSTDRLDPFVRDCFAYLGVFAPKPATFDLAAMKSQWQTDDPKAVANALMDRGLLEYIGSGRYQMHALLVAHAKSLLKD
jgi:NB-ARC domain